jgi:hypothetical protein
VSDTVDRVEAALRALPAKVLGADTDYHAAAIALTTVPNTLYRKSAAYPAFQLGEPMPTWFIEAVGANKVTLHTGTGAWQTTPDYALVQTLDGEMRANRGDWIIQGYKGEVYPCRADVFAATYEVVE